MTVDGDGLTPRVDIRAGKPTPARMYDVFLGGKDNFAVDRVAAQKITDKLGGTVTRAVVWENRRFLGRVVDHLARECGIGQFIDVGAGLPSMDNTHQVAQRVIGDVKVVYVDNDPMVAAHGKALFVDSSTTRIVTADMRDPETILKHPDTRELIDFDEPIAALFIAVFHFIRDNEDPARIVAAFSDRMASGSYVAISHLTSDGPPPDQRRVCEDTYAGATSPIIFRSRQEILSLFDGFELIEPGLVRQWQWRPNDQHAERTDWLYGGVGRKTVMTQSTAHGTAIPHVPEATIHRSR